MTGLGGRRVGFKRHLEAAVVPGEAAYLVSARGVTALRGRAIEVLAPLLDGSRTLAGIVRDAAPELRPDQVGALLGRLAEAKFLAFAEPGAEFGAEFETEVRTGADSGIGAETGSGAGSGAGSGVGTETTVSTGFGTVPGNGSGVESAVRRGVGGGSDRPDRLNSPDRLTNPDRRTDPDRLTNPDHADPRPALAYWELAGLDGATAVRAVATTPVELIEVGAVDRAAVDIAIAGSCLPVQVPDGAEPAALVVVLCDDYLNPRLARIDRRRRGDRRPWLLAKTAGPDLWIGPVFRPGAGPCWHCLAQRLTALRQADLRARDVTGVRLPEASIGAARAVAAQLAVLEAAKWLAGVREAGQDAVYTLDTLTLAGRHHRLTRRPQCPECGDPTLVAHLGRRPVVPSSRPRAGAGDRALDAQDLYDRYRHLVDPVGGVVRELVDQDRADGFVFRCAAASTVAVPAGPHDRGALRRTFSAGKGATALAARVGALGEAVERYCAARQGDEAVVVGSYQDLAPAAVHPDAVQLQDRRQLADRDRWNRAHGAAHWICEPFDDAEVREWTPVWSLTDQRERLLPTALLYFHHGRPGACRQVWADSTGNAAGASLEDAIVAGFLEIVERDAVALWWYNRTRQPGIDLDACDDPLVERAREVCARGGRELWALDLTADLPVSVVAAVSVAVGDRPARPMLGFGAHFDRRVALRRAVAELGQIAAVLHPVDVPMGPAGPVSPGAATPGQAAAGASAAGFAPAGFSSAEFVTAGIPSAEFGSTESSSAEFSAAGSGNRSSDAFSRASSPSLSVLESLLGTLLMESDEGQFTVPPQRRDHIAANPNSGPLPGAGSAPPSPMNPPLDQVRWWQALGHRPPGYLRPDPDRPTRSGAEPGPHLRPPHPDLGREVEDVVAMVRAAGLDLLVLDQTRPDVGMPVVKVLIPGMRPARARFAPGRLFDVPVALGRHSRPLAYPELNPVPLVL